MLCFYRPFRGKFWEQAGIGIVNLYLINDEWLVLDFVVVDKVADKQGKRVNGAKIGRCKQGFDF